MSLSLILNGYIKSIKSTIFLLKEDRIKDENEMRNLQRTQNQEELDGIINQKNRLDEAYKAHVKHLQEREKKLKNELKSYAPTKKKV